MSISRDAILLENIRASLRLYERSLVWAITAALSGLLIAIRLEQHSAFTIHVLNGELSAPMAWAIAQMLYFIFGILALTAVQRFRIALKGLSPSPEILSALLLYPSLATLPNPFFRIGSVLLPPLATAASWWLEVAREWHEHPPVDKPWFAMFVSTVVLLAPYVGILLAVRQPSGVAQLSSPAATSTPNDTNPDAS